MRESINMSPSSEIIVLFNGPASLGKAFVKVFDLFSLKNDSKGYKVVDLHNPGDIIKQAKYRGMTVLGLAVIWNDEEFFVKFSQLIAAGASGMVAVSVFKDSIPPWKKLTDPRQIHSFSSCCFFTGINIVDDILPALQELNLSTNYSAQVRAYRSACARNLIAFLKRFTHSAKHDITNTLFGPLRMMTIADSADKLEATWWETATKNWKIFRELPYQIEKKVSEFGDIGFELSETIKELHSFLDPAIKKDLPIELIDSILLLLTEIRKEAGHKPDTPSNTDRIRLNPIPMDQDISPEAYRILVVDDCAISWYPVLNLVANLIEEKIGQAVTIEFSDDGDEVYSSNGVEDLYQYLPDYDLVLLDIYLPGKKGTEILSKIRDRSLSIPVIMWTTSQDEELPSESVTANGFLFKKTTTCEKIAETICKWLPSGSGKRIISLPNPFFDHNIRTKEIRDCAISFTHYCLKLLDSFHALDDRYFKFFNDHGGRHFIGILGILEKLIRPLMFETSLFSEDQKEREIEILCLYVGVLCHELGMFPMKTENYQQFSGDDLFIARKQHALRGLKILANDNEQTPEFNMLMEKLQEIAGPFGRAAVVLITAYHSRVLNLKEDHFLTLKKATEKIKKQKYRSSIAIDIRDVRKNLNTAKNLLQMNASANQPKVDRLRRLCAVFRFADALDIDHTRIPADFLLHHEARSVLDDRENFKRQILENVSIDRGKVNLFFNVTEPKHHKLLDWLESVDKKQFEKCGIIDKQMLTHPWKENKRRKVKRIQKNLDLILETYFKKSDRDTDDECIKALGWATAISVCGELIDEYKAIEDNKLVDKIQLGKVCWAREEKFEHLSIPKKVPEFSKMLIINDPEKPAGLDKEEELALLTAFNEMFTSINNQETQKIHVKKVTGGFSPAKTLIVQPDGFQPRFCKIDNYKDIEQEYKGYRNFACLHYPAENLIHDVRLSKYRDRGIFLGSFIGEISKSPKTLESVFLDKLCKGEIDVAKDILSLFFDGVFLKRNVISHQEENYLTLYKPQLDLIEKNIKEIKKDIKQVRCKPSRDCAGESIRRKLLDKWEGCIKKWNRFKRILQGSYGCQSIIHGDLHPRNILLKQEFSGPSQFVLIDMFGTGYGHPLYDAAFLEGWLLTTTAEELMKKSRGKLSFDSARDEIAKVSEIIFPSFKDEFYGGADKESIAKYERECKIARLFRDFLLISVFPSGFSPETVNPILEWTWDRLNSTLESLT